MKHFLSHFIWLGRFILFICVLSSSSPESTISSVGIFYSQNLTWSYGVPNVTLNYVFECKLGSDFCRHFWMNNRNILARVENMTNAVSCEVTIIYHISNIVGSGICTLNANLLTSNITIVNTTKRKLNVSVHAGNSVITGPVLVEFKSCRKLPKNERKNLEISNSENAGFNQKSQYKCVNNSALVVDGYFTQNPEETYERNCEFNAVWSGTDEVICSFAPSVVLENVDEEKINATLRTGDNITICCKVEQEGNPTTTGVKFDVKASDKINLSCEMLGFIQVNWTVTILLSPCWNEASVYCQGVNNYTRFVNTSAGRSPPYLIKVQYGPTTKDDYYYDTVSSQLTVQTTISFNFSANPEIRYTDLTLNFSANGTDVNKTLTGGVLGKVGSLQVYNFTIPKVYSKDFGLYYLKIISAIESFDPLILTRELAREKPIAISTSIPNEYTTGYNITDSPAPLNNIPIVAIVAPVAGVCIITLIIILVCMRCRRKRERDKSLCKEERENPVYEASSTDAVTDKEEKLNPLYGSSGASQIVKEDRINPLYGCAGSTDNHVDETKIAGKKGGKIEKEERKNPLYASAGKDVVEDAYAEIEKKKVKKEVVSQDNALFSVEPVGDTYAEVKKPKKDKSVNMQSDATYSEVKKNRGSKKDGGLHGTVNETL